MRFLVLPIYIEYTKAPARNEDVQTSPPGNYSFVFLLTRRFCSSFTGDIFLQTDQRSCNKLSILNKILRSGSRLMGKSLFLLSHKIKSVWQIMFMMQL
jgi:hypothetical protein